MAHAANLVPADFGHPVDQVHKATRFGRAPVLGITSSPAFVREPEGNGCVERFIRTLKENLLWVRTFETVEDLRQALPEFKRQYNEQWILERLGYRTPDQARKDACPAVEIAA